MKTMNKMKISMVMSLLFVAMLGSSCKKWVDPEINKNPNKPTNVSMDVILPTTQVGLAYSYGGDIMRPTQIWTQHLAGINRQHLGYAQYKYTETETNNLWQFNLYAGVLEDLHNMISMADAKGAPHYKGVAEVMMAMGMGITTDLFGDVPYSQAWMGNDNLKPAYDSQEKIYNAIFTLLDDGIKDLAAKESNFDPGTDDVIYGGDLDKWTALANTLKARYALHLVKIDKAKYSAMALDAVKNGISKNADDADVVFGESETEGNPFYEFQNERYGDVSMGEFFINLMKGLNDPRMPVFAASVSDTANVFVGAPAGKAPADVVSDPGAYFTSVNSPVTLASYVENKFIEAEAAFYAGDLPRAASAYNEAVKASLAKYGVSNTIYETTNARTAANIKLEDIMTQKYIAMYTQLESFTDWRRTGLPKLTAADPNNTGGIIPRRYPYPLQERLGNAGNMPGASIIDPVWWDRP